MPVEHKAARPLTPEDVATVPQPGLAQPVDFQFSPDDALITFLYSPDHTRVRQLHAFDPATGERRLFFEPRSEGATDDNVSLEEALRRERARQWGSGVTDYAWAEKAPRLLVPLPDGVYVQDAYGAARRVIDGAVQDPRLSPDGSQIAFVQDGDLWVMDVAEGAARALTQGAKAAGVTRGLAEFIAAEEMDRHEGFWWSPDGTMIAFAEVDERHISAYRIVHQGKPQVGEGAQEDHHYPFAGAANALVRLAVVTVATGEVTWMDVAAGGPNPGSYEYLARVKWLPSGELLALLQDRRQLNQDWLRFNPRTGQGRLLLHESTRVWLNLHDMFHALPADYAEAPGGFIWAVEGRGFRHLQLYDANGRPVRPLTEGEWLVETLAGVDESRRMVYFTGTEAGATERQLYRVSLAGGKPKRITSAPGVHQVKLDHGCRRFVDTVDSLAQPPRVTLRSLDNDSELAVIYETDDLRVEELALTPPELVSLHNRSGELLYGLVYRPDRGRYGPGPYPTIVQVYGGPHAQLVLNSWRSTAYNMRAQYLRGLGFLVFVLDNRGSAGRGLQFEAAIRWDMGHLEVEDQVEGIRWLVQQGLADRNRVGIYGWSYGGYMALMCLARAPETFHAAVSGAPVTAMDGYDTHYTERYMGLPQENPQGYFTSSVLAHVGNITGRLLLVHGLIDENVHFRHTARLINALIRGRVPYELMLFPDERHMPRRLEDRVYMEERIRDFFNQSLR
ncbi:MAG: alpha/beta fold hydrolase [Nitrososphaerales archaeon]